MPQRFVVDDQGDAGTTISAANAARYSAFFLTFAEAVPLDSAVALYARLYPLFQQAHEELGYPSGTSTTAWWPCWTTCCWRPSRRARCA